jgi:glutamine synthetase
MDRVGEDFGIQVSLHPKPVSDHWNGTGAHISKICKHVCEKMD